MSAHEHADLTAAIAQSRDEFLAAFAGVSEELAAKKPAPDKWSLFETAEHMAVTQNGFLKRLREAEVGGAPPHDPQKEAALRAALVDRTTARSAPPQAQPNGRFPSLASALGSFRTASDQAIEFVEQCPNLLDLHSPHPHFGPMNGRALACVLADHPRRHLAQVREILAHVS